MPESPAPPARDERGTLLQEPTQWIGLREVRIHYGVSSLTISIVETEHPRGYAQGLSQLICIKQLPLSEFMVDPYRILAEYVDVLLAPVWRLSEGNSGGVE